MASDHSLTWLLTLRNRNAGAKGHSTGQQGTPSLSGPWTRNTHCQISTRGVLGVANRTVCLRSGDCLFGVKETTSSTEYHRRREHIGDSRTTTPQPHRSSTGSLENRPPVEEHDQTIILRLCLQLNARVVFHVWFDYIRGSQHLHPLGWDHASAPETRARVLVTLGTLEQVLDFVVWDCIDHGARPHLVERIVTNRSTSDTAVIQRDMEEPRHRTLRPAGPRNRCQQRSRTWRGSPVARKTQMLLDDGHVTTISKPAPSQWVAARAQ